MFIVRFQSALLRLLFSSFFCVLLGILCLFVLGFFFRLHRLLFYVLWWTCFLAFACTRHNKYKKCAIVWQEPVVRGATSRALRALLPSCVLRRRGPHSCAAPRRPRVPVPRARYADRFPGALPAIRCVARPPAVDRGPTSFGAASCATLEVGRSRCHIARFARFSSVLWLATTWPALLRRAATSEGLPAPRAQFANGPRCVARPHAVAKRLSRLLLLASRGAASCATL